MAAPRLLLCCAGDRIGDALLKFPVAAGLRSLFPAHHITWMTLRRPSAFAHALAPVMADAFDEIREMSGIGTRWPQLLRNPLPGERWDIIIVTEQRLLPTLVLRRARARLLVSPAARFRFSDRRPPPGEAWPAGIAARLALLAGLAAGQPLTTRARLTLPAQFHTAARALLPEGPAYIGLAPGAGGAAKRWPLEAFLEVARAVREAGCVPVFFLGPDEADMLPIVRAACPDALLPEQAAASSAPAGPLLTIALAGRLAAAVANDAGGGHLLAAGGAALVSLYGRTSALKFAPQGNAHVALRAADFGAERVAGIPVTAVVDALASLGALPAMNRNAPP